MGSVFRSTAGREGRARVLPFRCTEKEAVTKAHKEGHEGLPLEIFEVQEGMQTPCTRMDYSSNSFNQKLTWRK